MRRLPVLAVLLVALAGLAAPGRAPAAALPYVAIDPGHGGRDVGAVGRLPQGTDTGLPPRDDRDGRTAIFEKDVNLDVARRLQAWLEAHGVRTIMTRTTDAAGGDLPYANARTDLADRVEIANDAEVDLFVSVHHNAFRTTSSGTETYHFYYSSAAARALAGSVHESVVDALGLPDRGVREAGFYVLRHTEAPAILVEGAFLSNPDEALLVADPATRQRLAEAIGAGIVAYSERAPDPASARAGPADRRLPTLGPWRTRPRSVPDGYRLVNTGRANPIGQGGWLAVAEGFRREAEAEAEAETSADAGLPRLLGPWQARPQEVPEGYRVVNTGPNNAFGHGGFVAIRGE